MSDEDQKLMEQISLLAGQINRAKSQQAAIASGTPPSPAPLRSAGYGAYHRGQYPYTTQGRAGYRVAKPVHRHRSLVLNSAPVANPSNSDKGPASDDLSPSWVTRSDRHLQLINSSVFHEQNEARSKAIQQTRLEKQNQGENRERSQLMHHLKQRANPFGISANSASVPPTYEISIEGIRFKVASNGSKLVKLPGDPNGSKATPKVAMVGGVKFYRSKNGNMYRQAIVKAQRKSAAANKINVTCRNFSNTGSCPKGPMCRYVHDPSKVAACKMFLQKGTCSAGDQCDLSHDLIPERTPHCVHYAKGNCRAKECPYTHRILPPGALVCRSFGFYGYCDKGISCPDRHIFECPDFSNTGVCKTKGCKLPHRERASVLRKANAAPGHKASRDDDDDLSSDDANNSVSSDDVDSDEVDEFVSQEDPMDFDKDFISIN